VEPLAALVVGCGDVGSGYDEQRLDGPPLSHAGAYAAHRRTRLVGGVDSDADARRRFEGRWQARAYAGLEEAIADCGPCVVSVCTPADVRPALVARAVDAGARAIWAEKPLASSAAAAEELVALCERADVPLQVNFLRRFDKLHRRVATVVGTRFRADFRFSGSLENYGAHAFDLFRWYAGEVSAARPGSVDDGEPLILLESPGGASASFWRVPSGDVDMFECDFYTDRGRFTLAGLGARFVRWEPTADELFSGVRALGPPALDGERGLEGAMLGGVASLAACIDTGEPLLCNGRDGLAALRMEEAARAAARTGNRVPIANG
jgi:predicted dehydrogenase